VGHLRGEYQVVYVRKSFECATLHDPNDQAFIALKLRLLEKAWMRVSRWD
jgi:hypothetical protein